ncbi:MAG TPA: hypothetical protein VFG23_27725 [Polyangia bacterium]|nr:hypothetical protein [Polyangia bacterium]
MAGSFPEQPPTSKPTTSSHPRCHPGRFVATVITGSTTLGDLRVASVVG